MNLQQYRENKKKLSENNSSRRLLCSKCVQPQFSCYCNNIQKFDPKIKFVILIHPIEVRRRIATGRMSHLILENSELISGQNYSENSEVNKILNDENYYSVMLYPGRQSIDLTPLNTEDRQVLFPQNKQLAVFVIDGTWATARKMVSQSMNLASLPRICFTPPRPSQFRVRKQPHPLCYSTIEAIHHTIELIGDSQTFSVVSREHDKLLKVFDFMVERQLFFIQESLLNSRTSTYRKPNSRNLLVPVL